MGIRYFITKKKRNNKESKHWIIKKTKEHKDLFKLLCFANNNIYLLDSYRKEKSISLEGSQPIFKLEGDEMRNTNDMKF